MLLTCVPPHAHPASAGTRLCIAACPSLPPCLVCFWEQFRSPAHRPAVGLRAGLQRLAAGMDRDAAWAELWQGLHHQGDVCEASYAAVPHLVRIQPDRGD